MDRICNNCLENKAEPHDLKCKDCGGGIEARRILANKKKYEEQQAQRIQEVQNVKKLETKISNLQAQNDALKLSLREISIESQRGNPEGLGIFLDGKNGDPTAA